MPVADLSFIPNTLSSLNLVLPDSHTLLAAGGQDAEIHLSLHSPSQNRALWHFSRGFSGSRNNSVVLSRACDGSHEPRLIVSNNDGTVRIYEVPLHGEPQNLRCCGSIRLQEPVNHCVCIISIVRALVSVCYSAQLRSLPTAAPYSQSETRPGSISTLFLAVLNLPSIALQRCVFRLQPPPTPSRLRRPLAPPGVLTDSNLLSLVKKELSLSGTCEAQNR
jgi:hypothetical protein